MEKIYVKQEEGKFYTELNISVAEWEEILSNQNITTENYKFALLAFYHESEHKSTCSDIRFKYYKNTKDAQSFNAWIINFGKAVIKHLNRFQIIGTDGKETFWAVAMETGEKVNGKFEWTLRSEIVKAIENLNWKMYGSWVPFYMEMADKLLLYKDKRNELLDIVYGLDKKYVGYIRTNDGSNEIDIDPFSVFGIFNRGISNENRIKLCEYFKQKLSIKADVPLDFEGVPILNNMKATFFGRDSVRTDIPQLWNLFGAVVLNDISHAKEYFDVVRNQKGIKWNITFGLFWIRPYDYISLDEVNRTYLPKIGVDVFNEKQLNATNYFLFIENLKDKIKKQVIEEKDFLEILYRAWTYCQKNKMVEEESMVDEPVILNNLDVNNMYWFVGYTFGEDGSQIERFINESVWESRFDENNPIDQKQISLVKSIKKGDVLILKSTSTKGANHDMPFLRIKAIGIVTSGVEITKADNLTQCKFDVDYINSEEKDFDGAIYGAYRQTIHQVDAKLKEVIDYVNNHITKMDKIMPYSKKDFLNEVFMSDSDYDKLYNLLLRKKNIILQGAPGVGKTFAAKRLAYSIIGSKNEDCVCHVQFHQNYSYEDFIMGYKPEEDKFILRKGIFYDFCTLAKNNLDEKYFFIIDEINRGNLSKIFGELLMLIENNYRGDKHKIKLAYNNEEFYVPEKLYIIGMMNTADRSLAMIDYALRRRFSFFEMKPGFETDGFNSLINKSENEKFKNLIEQIKKLNNQIVADDSLGKGFEIGHSYFCFDKKEDVTDEWLLSIVDYDIIPMLEEYWFDNKKNVSEWSENLRKIFEK